MGRPVAGRRDLWVLTAGQAVSAAGDAAALVALLLRLRPGGSGWVAALLAAELVPVVVLAPLVGRLVDRLDTRRVLLVALLGQAAVAVPLALVGTRWATVALAGVLSCLGALVRPATSALVPALAGEAAAGRGYARLATGRGLGFIAGPALGGLLTGALGGTVTLLVDAGSFGVVAVACAALRVGGDGLPAAAVTDRVGGLALLRADRLLLGAVLVTAAATACAVVDNVAAPFRFVDQLGASDAGYGTYLALWGVGALLGSQLPPRLRRDGEEVTVPVGNLLVGLGIAGIGLAPGLLVAYAAAVLGGFGNGLGNVAMSTLVARRVPPERRGRVFAASGAALQTGVGIGTAAAAPVVALLGGGGAMRAAGSLTVLVAAGGLVFGLRRHRPAAAPDYAGARR